MLGTAMFGPPGALELVIILALLCYSYLVGNGSLNWHAKVSAKVSQAQIFKAGLNEENGTETETTAQQEAESPSKEKTG